MKQRKPIPRRAAKPKRKRPGLFFKPRRDKRFMDSRSYVTKGGRFRLFGMDKQKLRVLAYRRSINAHHVPMCECGCNQPAWWYWPMFLSGQGELSHNEHGCWKSDELDRVKWMRHECHERIYHSLKSGKLKGAA